jgi:arabinan endo-1,5-alpha-L-arabinosidase
MSENHHEILIHKNDSFVGVGHNSEIVRDNAGNDWILYHGFCVENTSGRSLFLDQVTWEDDWPVVRGNQPSLEAGKPDF